MQDSSVQQARIYTDFSGLNELKAQARTDKKAALAEVARQFESLFLGEMLKSMRKAGDVFSEDNYLNSNESQHYRDMFDNQLSLTLAGQRGGTGLAEALVRQLSRQIPGMSESNGRLSSHKATLADYDRSLPALSEKLPEQVKEVERMAAAEPEMAASVPVKAEAAMLPRSFNSPAEFVRELLPVARRVAAESGIDPRVMIAQAALETGWGKHMIEGEGASPSHNLFGIKADHRWQGESVNIATTEFREGVPMSERASFRAYPDYESSFRDYVSFLESNPRYRGVLASADQPEVFAQKLQDAGYATDPQYGAKIRRIMNGDSLMTSLMTGSMGNAGSPDNPEAEE
ncbi:flagellar rod assembly protein/muramidase FlgJ [Marinobacter lipolyticus SM19]|uniref:Peptidoglycan hydrolase FlgJ n=1 Tax=Marinobacter lipolyticus SM19 TaxID=1318628 RepID=R8B187_9GAMM|nr:flagellar assembly peptidoglycan hydrolase FlgJ [Marinobacter lipolyticus]EON92345.1 flagellar rod assembly protein/muramidase FlgJ [Marinobacter lipolyticus SM19]